MVEVAVVLALTWLPFFYGAATWIVWPAAPSSTSFRYDMLTQIVSAVQILVPLLYVLWRSGDRWSEFGVRPARPVVDALMAGTVLLVVFIANRTFWMVASPLYWSMTDAPNAAVDRIFAPPAVALDYVLLIAGCIAIGAYEEMTMRGFLIPRLELLLGSTGKAVLVSSLVFASYHVYQHPVSVLSVFITGLVFGAAFCLFRRIWPLILAHAMIDIVGYLWN